MWSQALGPVGITMTQFFLYEHLAWFEIIYQILYTEAILFEIFSTWKQQTPTPPCRLTYVAVILKQISAREREKSQAAALPPLRTPPHASV